LPRYESRNRYPRSNAREQDGEGVSVSYSFSSTHVQMELPPGATFDPDPQKAIKDLTAPKPESVPPASS